MWRWSFWLGINKSRYRKSDDAQGLLHDDQDEWSRQDTWAEDDFIIFLTTGTKKLDRIFIENGLD